MASVLVDRAISVLSIIFLGGIAYIFSPKTRGQLKPKTADPEPQAQTPA